MDIWSPGVISRNPAGRLVVFLWFSNHCFSSGLFRQVHYFVINHYVLIISNWFLNFILFPNYMYTYPLFKNRRTKRPMIQCATQWCQLRGRRVIASTLDTATLITIIVIVIIIITRKFRCDYGNSLWHGV